jgi:iron(III) transport system permease protein
VVAIGVLPVVAAVDRVLDSAASSMLGISTGLLLLGSGAALVYAYATRFLAITIGGAEAALSKVSRSLDDAAATLGTSRSGRLWHIHLPLIRPAVATAALLVFVDCMKELPVTLLLRPIGVETLATHLYGEAARGTYEDAAVAALVIVVVGLGPVALLSRIGRRGRSNLLG